MGRCCTALLYCACFIASGTRQCGTAVGASGIGHTDLMDESWLKFRDDLSNALRAFVRGDAGPYTALWSHSADTSIMVPLAATTGDGTTSPNGWIGLPPSTATA